MAGMVKATITEEKGVRWLTVKLPMEPKARPSASGKTMVVATTNGNAPVDAEVDGHQLVVGLNAYYKA